MTTKPDFVGYDMYLERVLHDFGQGHRRSAGQATTPEDGAEDSAADGCLDIV